MSAGILSLISPMPVLHHTPRLPPEKVQRTGALYLPLMSREQRSRQRVSSLVSSRISVSKEDGMLLR